MSFSRHLKLSLLLGLTAVIAAPASADWVELTNRDVVQGEVISLDKKELKLKSENFGEMTIPRDKVELIGMGDRPVPKPDAPTRGGAIGGSEQLMQSPQVNRLLEQALGGGGIGGLQQNLDQTRRGLEDLQEDLGPGPSSDALDSYIQMFRMFGNVAPSLEGAARSAPGNQSPPGNNNGQ